MYEQLQLLDWCVIGVYFLFTIYIGMYFSGKIKEASKNAEGGLVEYFVAGRKMTWWLAGTSIVATSFAADTPLVISGWIRTFGLQRNWFWWGGIMGMMLCTFFYARLWRRARIITDIEFVELRYCGAPAATLRGFHATYRALIQNMLILSWVTLAAAKIMEVSLNIPNLVIFKNFALNLTPSGAQLAAWCTTHGIDPNTILLYLNKKWIGILICMVITVIYCIFSGLWGIIATDCFQFLWAMSGCIILAIIVLVICGGPSHMIQHASDMVASGAVDNGVSKLMVQSDQIISFTPPFDFQGGGMLAIWAFIVFIGLQWWAGGEGGGFLAQRLFSCKNEKHSVGAMLWFNLLHFVVRPWPWIIVGIGSLYLVPKISAYGAHYDQEYAYVIMFMKFLPIGLKGIMVAALMAAYMSCVATHINFGTSYLINDIYKRFLVRNTTQKHYIRASQICIVFVTIIQGIFAYYNESISRSWLMMLELMSGTGFVVLLRWYWWRINPWSEISAMISSLVIWLILNNLSFFGAGNPEMFEKMYPIRFTVNILLSTVVWVTVTFLTKPVDEAHLINFYKRVRPAGFWKAIAIKAGNPNHLQVGWPEWIGWFSGVLSLFFMLFSIGKLCFGDIYHFILYGVIAFCSTLVMYKMLKKMDWSGMPDFDKEVDTAK